MDTQHCNALLDFVEAMGEKYFTVNNVFSLYQHNSLLQFEIDLKNDLIDKLSEEILHLMSDQNIS